MNGRFFFFFESRISSSGSEKVGGSRSVEAGEGVLLEHQAVLLAPVFFFFSLSQKQDGNTFAVVLSRGYLV